MNLMPGRRFKLNARHHHAPIRLRFIDNSMRHYIFAFYGDKDHPEGSGIVPILRLTGFIATSARISEVLTTRIGELTAGQFIREERNKMLAHPRFRPDLIMRAIFRRSDMKAPANRGAYAAFFFLIRSETLLVRARLVLQYPEAARFAESWPQPPPVDKPD